MEGARGVGVVANLTEETAAPVGILANIVEHLVIEEKVDHLQLCNLGYGQVEMPQHLPQLPEARLVVVDPQVLQHLYVLVLSLGEGLVILQPLPESSDVALLEASLALPQPPVLVQQVNFLLNARDLALEERCDDGLRLAYIDGPQELQLLGEHP